MPKKVTDDKRIFDQSLILKSLSSVDRQTLFEKSIRLEFVKQFDAEQNIIFDKGDAGDCMYLLIDGAVDLSTIDLNGNEKTLAHIHQPGSYFGEQALFDSLKNRTARAKVVSDACVLRTIHLKEFDEIVLGKQNGLYDKLNQHGNVLLQKDSLVFSNFLSGHVNNPLQEQTIELGTEIYKEGASGERFYLILDGQVNVWRNGNHIATLIEGNYFGDTAILKKQPHQITVKAGERLRVVSIDAADFYRLHHQSDTVKDYIKSMNGFNRNDHGIVYSQHQSHYKNKSSITTILSSKNGEACSITKVVGHSHLIKFARQVNMADDNDKNIPKQEIDLSSQELLETISDKAQHRLFYLQNNRLIGAEISAEYANLDQIVPAIIGRKYIWPWQKALFRFHGDLWIKNFHQDPRDKAVICLCTGTTRGELKQKVVFGCNTVDQLANETGASQVCESCTSSVAEIAASTADMIVANVLTVPEAEIYCNNKQDIKCFRFKPEDGKIADYLPGQHVRLEAEINGQWIQRAYTLTSDTRQKNHYEIAVKREPTGVFSRWLHDNLNTTSLLRISRPQGRFHLSPASRNPVVCFVNGVGVTPVIAFIRHLSQINSNLPLYFDYSVSTVSDVAFIDEFKSIAVNNFTGKLRITREINNIDEFDGILDQRFTVATNRIAAHDIQQLTAEYPEADYYICGSRAFDETLQLYLHKNGIEAEKIHSEQFNNCQKHPSFLMAGSMLTLILALSFLFMPAFTIPGSVDSFDPVNLFTSNFSGYSILGLGAIGLLIALPRRWEWVRKISAESLRLLHVWLGVLALILLFFHTGYSMGGIHTTLLTICFVLLFIVGSIAAVIIALQESLSPAQTYIYKKYFKWTHILLAWPLPVLLLTHILSTYANSWF